MIKLEYSDGGLEIRLRNLRVAMQDMRPVWEGPVHTIFMTMMKAQFEREGAYAVSEKWKPLSPQYAAWKQRQVGTKPILQLYGPLMESLTLPDAEGHVMRVGPSYAEYGTSINYAATHHFGDATRNIPKRTVIPKLTKAEGSRIVYAIEAFLFGRMRGETRRGGTR